MDDLARIRRKLSESASGKREEKRLLQLFDSACSGLNEGMMRGVKAEIGERLGDLLGGLEEKAKIIETKVTE